MSRWWAFLLLAGCAGAADPPRDRQATTAPAPAPIATATATPTAPALPLPPSDAEGRSDAPPTARFLAVGDVLLSRGVAAAIEEAGDPRLVYGGMKHVFERVDFVFANLEFPFAEKTVVPVRGNVFNAPRAWVEGLVEHRFRILNLANNHAMDQGEQGLFDTIALLREHALSPFGAGKNEREAWTPAVIEVRGIRIGFVGASYASINDSGDTWLRHVARIEDKGRLRSAIAEVRERADFVVATMHAGIEYVPVPFGPQILFAKAAIDAGADIVIGAHPHVVQPVELHRGRYVFHSLGNFIFDQTGRHTDEGAALEIVLERQGGEVVLDRVEVLPVVIEGGIPRPAPPAIAEAIAARMKLESLPSTSALTLLGRPTNAHDTPEKRSD